MSEVTEDPNLTSAEKEFTIRVNKAEDCAVVHSDIASVTRALLSREDFIERERRTVDEEVVGVRGELPIGALKVQQNTREYGSFSSIVSDHE